MSSDKEFKAWWKVQKGMNYFLGDIHELCAKKAWDHQQSKLDAKDELLKEAIALVEIIECSGKCKRCDKCDFLNKPEILALRGEE